MSVTPTQALRSLYREIGHLEFIYAHDPSIADLRRLDWYADDARKISDSRSHDREQILTAYQRAASIRKQMRRK